jgi:hypothetical protein
VAYVDGSRGRTCEELSVGDDGYTREGHDGIICDGCAGKAKKERSIMPQ